MTTTTSAGIRLDAKAVQRLLDLLASDDDFRDLFTKSPYDALCQAGAAAAADEESELKLRLASIGLTVQTLASKDAIRALRSSLETQLRAGIGMQPILLNVQGLANRSLRAPEPSLAD